MSTTKSAKIALRSEAFAEGAAIPRRYTEDGADVSPPLAWDAVPAGTKELALICDDPDAPTAEPWVHWVLYKIPAEDRSLAEGVPAQSELAKPAGALQGKNSWTSGRRLGYRGPAPPSGHGVHHYQFRLYALDAPLAVSSGLDKAGLLKVMAGHVLAEGGLIGTYER